MAYAANHCGELYRNVGTNRPLASDDVQNPLDFDRTAGIGTPPSPVSCSPLRPAYVLRATLTYDARLDVIDG